MRWTKELDRKLKEDVAHGFVFTVVAERLGTPVTGKDVLARVNKLELRHELQQDDVTDPEVLRRRWQTPIVRKEREQQIKKLWWKGLSLCQIAKRFDPPMSTTNVLFYIRRMQVRGEPVLRGGRRRSFVTKKDREGA